MEKLSKNTTINAEMEREREEFLSSIDVRILESADDAKSFNAIIDPRRGIVIR